MSAAASRPWLRAVGVVGALTLLSRVLGLGRDILMAGLFGTSLSMSAFVVAFTLPNLFRRLFGEGALSAALIPVFVETRAQAGDEVAWALARRVMTLLAAGLGVVTLVICLGLAAADQWGAFSPKVHQVLRLGVILFPYMPMICLAAACMALLNARGRFAVPAAAPCLLNLIWCGVLLAIVPWLPADPAVRIRAVAWGILAAGLAQWLVQLESLRRLGFRPGLAWPSAADERLRRVGRLMAPAALGLAVTQINVLIDRLLAAGVGDWAPAALFYAERLVYLPLGIFATALGTVLLPTFSRQAVAAEPEALRDTLGQALRLMAFVMLPAAAALWLLAPAMIRLLFEWRTFSAESTLLTARALRFYAPGLLLFSLPKTIVPVFYAHQDTKTPVRLGVAAVLLNIVLSVAFVLSWPTAYKHAGIALATVLAEGCYTAALLRALTRRGWAPPCAPIGRSLLRIGLATLGLLGAAYGAQMVVTARLLAAGFGARGAAAGALVAAGAAGLGVFLLIAALLRAPELSELRKREMQT